MIVYLVSCAHAMLLALPAQDGRTPAFWAARKGNVEVLELLRDAGANLNRADKVLIPSHPARRQDNVGARAAYSREGYAAGQRARSVCVPVLCVQVRMCVCVYVHMFVCVYLYLYVCMCICYVYVCMCMCVCVCVCMCMCMCVCVYVCMCTSVCMWVGMCRYVDVGMYVCVCVHVCICVCL